MEPLKMKMILGKAEISLEGEGNLVHTIFQELREKGLGRLDALKVNEPPAGAAVKNSQEEVQNLSSGIAMD